MKLILPFFILWSIPTVLFFYLPVPVDISSFQLSLTLYLFVGIYLLLASSLSYWVIVNVFSMNSLVLYMNGVIVVMILGALYWYATISAPFKIVLASLSTANLLFGSTLLGAVLSVAIKRVGELVPVCLTAAVADLTSVLKGPTKIMAADLSAYYEGGMQGTPPAIDAVLIKAGVPGHTVPVPLFGVSDWILLILLSSSLIRLQKTDNLLADGEMQRGYLFFPVTTLALYIGLLTAQITHIFLPAMVFICAIFLGYLVCKHKVHLKLTKSDCLNSLFFPSVSAALILLLTS